MEKVNANSGEGLLISEVIQRFYDAFYKGDSIYMYSYLNTEFQRGNPLNYFLLHERYRKDFGRLVSITNIEINDDCIEANVDCICNIRGEEQLRYFYLKKDFGGWKIKANNMFNR